MVPDDLAQLELELRRLAGVVLVTFTAEGDGATVVGLTVERGAPAEVIRAQTRRLAEAHLDGRVVVSLHATGQSLTERRQGRGLRVQLLAVARPAGGKVEVLMAYRDRRSITSCRPGDRVGVAGAVIEGLGKLGLRVPYEATAVHVLSGELGEGAMVHLRHEALWGVRRGLAAGRREDEAIARAVLNGLNRFLEDGSGRERIARADGVDGAQALPTAL